MVFLLRCEGRFKGLTPRELMKWQAYAIGAGFATSTSLWVDQYWLHILTSTTWRGDQYWFDWQSVLVCLALSFG